MERERYRIIIERALPFLKGLESLYREMDSRYNTAAAQYPFECGGCEDNCCLTFFYHHTIVEYLYLTSGFVALSPDIQEEITQKARHAVAVGQGDAPPKIMCPLNTNGLCLLYRFRPMICRLHGIPNEMRRPDGITLRGPGCPQFRRIVGENAYVPFDRTPFYLKMATIEKSLRSALNIQSKFKKSVSEMITDFGNETS